MISVLRFWGKFSTCGFRLTNNFLWKIQGWWMESLWVHYVYSMCILSSLCVFDLLAIYFVCYVYLLCLWCVFYHMCVTCVFYMFLGILFLRFSCCLWLDMSLVFGVFDVYLLAMCFLWVLCLTFCFSCVMCLMSSMCSGSYVRAMGFQYSMCLISQDYVFSLYWVFYVAKEVCVFFLLPNLSLFFKWSSLSLAWMNPCSMEDIYPY
jgi:hypothetical protein